MSMLPQTKQAFDTLPADALARDEAIQDIFGEQLFALRDYVISHTESLVELSSERESLGNIRRRDYDEVAALSDADRVKAIRLADRAVQYYIQHVMALLDNKSVNIKLGPSHFLRYRLIAEVHNFPEIAFAEEHVVNDSQLPTLGEKFGKWLNRFRRK